MFPGPPGPYQPGHSATNHARTVSRSARWQARGSTDRWGDIGCCSTLVIRVRPRWDTRPGRTGTCRTAPGGAWWPADGVPLQRRIRFHHVSQPWSVPQRDVLPAGLRVSDDLQHAIGHVGGSRRSGCDRGNRLASRTKAVTAYPAANADPPTSRLVAPVAPVAPSTRTFIVPSCSAASRCGRNVTWIVL